MSSLTLSLRLGGCSATRDRPRKKVDAQAGKAAKPHFLWLSCGVCSTQFAASTTSSPPESRPEFWPGWTSRQVHPAPCHFHLTSQHRLRLQRQTFFKLLFSLLLSVPTTLARLAHLLQWSVATLPLGLHAVPFTRLIPSILEPISNNPSLSQVVARLTRSRIYSWTKSSVSPCSWPPLSSSFTTPSGPFSW